MNIERRGIMMAKWVTWVLGICMLIFAFSFVVAAAYSTGWRNLLYMLLSFIAGLSLTGACLWKLIKLIVRIYLGETPPLTSYRKRVAWYGKMQPEVDKIMNHLAPAAVDSTSINEYLLARWVFKMLGFKIKLSVIPKKPGLRIIGARLSRQHETGKKRRVNEVA